MIQSKRDSNVGRQRCVHAGFLQNNGADMLWNGEVQVLDESNFFRTGASQSFGSDNSLLPTFNGNTALGKLLRTTLQRSVSL